MLKQLLQVCDLSITLEDDIMVITSVNKGSYQNRRNEGKTFSEVLRKAYRQMLKDAGSTSWDPED